MRNHGTYLRSALAGAAAITLGLTALTACDGQGGDPPGARSGASHAKPSPRPRPEPAQVWDTSPASLAAVGDSITRGFDACSVLSDCPEVSWATGSDPSVHSLAVRLLGKREAAAHSWNYAVTGARMADLAGQMEQAAARRPQLVAVMAGANDACRGTVAAMTPVDRFRGEFEKALRTLRHKLPRTQVYVASVPDLKHLWSTGRVNPLSKQVWKLGICPSMLDEPDATDAATTSRRNAVQARVIAYNKVLREVCAKDERCRFDDGAVYDYRFGMKQLSHWDWFHPSRNGQAQLADIAFSAVTRQEAVS